MVIKIEPFSPKFNWSYLNSSLALPVTRLAQLESFSRNISRKFLVSWKQAFSEDYNARCESKLSF